MSARRFDIDLRAARPLAATGEARHAETVMDLSIAGDAVATIDFAGNWAVRRCADLQQLAAGTLTGRFGRHIVMSPDREQLAVLTGEERIDHDYSASIVDVRTGRVQAFGHRGYRRLTWTDAGLIAMGYRGFWIHDRTGRLVTDGEIRGVGDVAWMGHAATRDGARIYYLSQHRLRGIGVADGLEQPAPDLAPFAKPVGDAAWAFPDIVVNDDGTLLALGFLDEALLWRIPSGELLAHLVPGGVQIVGTHVRFAGHRLVSTFTHVMANSGHRKSIAVFDVNATVVDLVSTDSEVHGTKGGADGNLLVAHGPELMRVRSGASATTLS